MTDALQWPTDRPELADLPQWLSSVLPGRPQVRGPVEVLRVKRWGATAAFEADGQRVVAKHAEPALFPHAIATHRVAEGASAASVPALLAHAKGPAWQRSAFSYIPGRTVAVIGPHDLVRVAATLGRVQAAAAKADLSGLPQYDVRTVPDILAEDLASAGDLDRILTERFLAALPTFRAQAAVLASELPVSLDHPDMNDTNAIIADDSTVVLLDWEEATVGCPLFSLDRLLVDALEGGNAAHVVDAYLHELPWAPRRELHAMLDLALMVAPLKLASEARAFSRALGWPLHTQLTTKLVSKALDRLADTERNAPSAVEPRW